LPYHCETEKNTHSLELSNTVDESDELTEPGRPDEVDGGSESGVARVLALKECLGLVLGDEGEEAADVFDEVTSCEEPDN
jgi:hypothetical protein